MTRRARAEADYAGGALMWEHTEFGRRTTDGEFRVVRHLGVRWQLLDHAWQLLGTCDSIGAAQQLAEQIVRRAAAAAGRTR